MTGEVADHPDFLLGVDPKNDKNWPFMEDGAKEGLVDSGFVSY
jgi:hypothetical protein